eukprot:gnl/TRDRNA2_/TRDRNA2_168516_c0_seq2.p1 gnl/TRDRNA2_/TRDRNA2_168516_c0~~gnl/TRDRNA2_/TRDRNA2_168516_c0_seq2.p1  ORF type:complete len:468 (+),score=117.43 gnl/TRDRNA2_/TRDRNA2_168516_c0_seq2:70-1473(+)
MWHIYGLLLLASFALLRADDCGDNAIEKCDSFALYQTSSMLLKAKDRAKNIGLDEHSAKTLMASSEKAAAQEPDQVTAGASADDEAAAEDAPALSDKADAEEKAPAAKAAPQEADAEEAGKEKDEQAEAESSEKVSQEVKEMEARIAKLEQRQAEREKEKAAAQPTALTGSRQSSEEQLIAGGTRVKLPEPPPGMQSSGLSLPLLGDGMPQHPWMWVQGKPVVEFLLGHTATKALIDVYGSEEHGDQKADPTPSQGDPQTSTREPTIGEQYAFTHETEVPTNRVQLIVSLAIWSCLVLLVAKFFKREEGDTPPEDEKRVKRTNEEMQQWSSGAFDCFQSLPLCIASLCCPLVVFADTMASVHVVKFWSILGALVAVALLDLFALQFKLPILYWTATSLVMVYYRHKLRAKFDMAHYTFSTIAGDFLGYCMCFPCFISQEARHVEEAVFSGHSAVKALEEKEPAEDAA